MLCPDSSQWKLSAKAFCNISHSWFNCLYDENNKNYTQFCRNKPDFQRPGYKFIIRGSLDGKPCNTNKFQPFKFWTNSSSDCVFKKTNCTEEGQVVFDKGNSTANRKCRCDYTSGYAFVTQPRHDCYCDPELEDCSCYVLTCRAKEVITPGSHSAKLTDNETVAITSTIVILLGLTSGDFIEKRIAMEVEELITSNSYSLHDNYRDRLGTADSALSSRIKTREFIEKRVAKEEGKRITSNRNELDRAKLCLKVNYKDIVTTVKNDEIVKVLEHQNRYLKKYQIEQIQSCLGKIKRNQKLLEIIWSDGIIGFDAFVSALEFAGSYKTLIDKIIRTKEDADINLDALDTEVDGLYNEHISKVKRDYFEMHLNDWQQYDKVFVETKATKYTEEMLRANNFCIVVGGLGFGKTAILRHLALKLLYEENYDIIPKVMSPLDIIDYLHPHRKQIFVVDNIEDEPANSWSLQTDEISKQLNDRKGNMKLLISCEKQVYNNLFKNKEQQFESLCDLSLFPLSDDEIRTVLAVYIGEKQISNALEFEQNAEYGVPFLCKLSRGRDIGTIQDLFKNPLKYIEQDLKKMRRKNNLEFCVMTLITLSDNCFKKEWLNKNKSLPEDLQTAIEEVCDDFGLDFKNESTKAYIKERFERPDTVYINRTGEQYHLLHHKVLEIMARLCSEHLMNTFIQHASVSFISSRCLFASIPGSSERNIFLIEKKNEEAYFDRLFTDLKHGDMLSTFHNSQLTFELYKNKFIKYCRKPESNFKNILSKLQTLADETKRDCEDVVDDYEHLKWKAQAKKCNQPVIASVWEGCPDMVQLLIDMECDVCATDRLNRSALFFAALFGYSKIVNLLAQHRGDISMCDVAGRSPLYVACDTGHANVVKCLLNLNVNVSKCANGGRSPLFIACATGHRDIVETLLTKSECNVSKADDSDQSPLFVASTYGRSDIVTILLEHEANIEQYDNRGYTPLFAATINGASQHIKVIQTLLDHNADISHCDNTGRTALFIACEKGFHKVVEILINHSEDIISKCDKEQKSPLFVACEYGHANIVHMLVKKEKHADINKCDAKGRSPLFIACFMGHEQVVEALLENNAEVDLCDKDGRSPFYISSRGGYVEIMNKLFDKKANIHKFNRWGGSVLNVTCREGHLKAVEFLLKNKVDISKADNNGYTALYMASDQGHTRIVDMLLKEDANVNVQTFDNMTPLHTACARGHIEIARLLLEYKAEKDITNNANATPKDLAKQNNNIAILNLLSDKA
ncbi:unnamed protein product [Mytilus coruscus]|uniref:Novel STAND NTPase 3 domain-containing protein n=1 Tax=Mytilus coruscus TaxID=42192 RepID=A0A6J8CQW4_MYTCO|nr:unnamed protein product [Mytilus coruscus]